MAESTKGEATAVNARTVGALALCVVALSGAATADSAPTVAAAVTPATAATAVTAIEASEVAVDNRRADRSLPVPWGSVGHGMAARAAVAVLPASMPAFFRGADEQFAYLNPEPDRWRDFNSREMDQAFSYDHYIDMENVPAGALDARDRFTFLRTLYDAGVPQPERDVGFLPFRIVELYQRLVTEWGLWRREDDPQRRSWIEQRILNDAGILGHYVTDGSQPHHTTIHFNGWNGSDAFGTAVQNPEGYTEDNGFHQRFERSYVEAHLEQIDVSRRVTGAPQSVAGEARGAVLAYLQETFSNVGELYRLDRDVGFETAAGAQTVRETRDFTADRLAAGAQMLSVLWWSAWLESEG